MNFNLTQIPERTVKPRKMGLTMVMDKGLSYGEAENFLSISGVHTDVLKLGFGTSFVTPNLRAKIELYQSHNIPVYFGGTLFEAFVIRNQFDDYLAMCKDYNILLGILKRFQEFIYSFIIEFVNIKSCVFTGHLLN